MVTVSLEEDLGVSAQLSSAMAQLQQCIETRDQEAGERLLDEEFELVLVVPSRTVFGRSQWLEVLPSYVVHEYVVEEQIVDEDGDAASVLHRVHMRATVLGADRSGQFVISDFWRLRQGGWRIWRRHSTPMAGTPLPEAIEIHTEAVSAGGISPRRHAAGVPASDGLTVEGRETGVVVTRLARAVTA